MNKISLTALIFTIVTLPFFGMWQDTQIDVITSISMLTYAFWWLLIAGIVFVTSFTKVMLDFD
ncbi:MAG: hypothetical protein KAR62_02155 [Sphingomonadales bacterium]|nr:hypothetical protein [Sphingomonadales bacterium]